jgi:pretoxin HINT domain-containing protein
LEGVIPEAAASGLVGAGSGAVTGGVTGAADYGLHCGNACSASGLAGAAGGGALVGGALGGVFGAVGGLRGGGRAEEPSAGTEEATPATCHSFAGGTRVLMADGSAKPIGQVRVGDRVADSVPGDGRLQVHTVQRVIVTTTDHDFVDVTVKPNTAGTGGLKALAVKVGTAIAGLALAAVAATAGAQPATAATGAAVAQPAAVAQQASVAGTDAVSVSGSTVTTTFHHPFYDITQAAFVDAATLHTGDQLQTAGGGTAVITGLRLYHQTTTTYDLTINGLHTYYVVAGRAAVLVHNCGDTVYRTPNAGNKERESNGLDPSLHRTGDRSAYLGDKSVVTEHYASQPGYESGYFEYQMHPDFASEFGQYRRPYDGGDGFQWQIPVQAISRFNQLIITQRWVNYYGGYEW